MQHKIILSFEDEAISFAIIHNKIYYVKISKPCAVSDFNDPFAKPSIAPYLLIRNVSYGIVVDNPDGYSCRYNNIQSTRYKHPVDAMTGYNELCKQLGCHLSWNEVQNLMHWG